MIRQNREVTDLNHIEAIFKLSIVCRIAFNNSPAPYIIPMNYGYHDGKLYLHTANEGLKLELINKNNSVGFQIDNKIEMVQGVKGTTMKYQSIVGEGIIRIIQDNEEKQECLKYLIEHHGGSFKRHSESSLTGVTMLIIDITKFTAKANI
ncbi:pyridoxamine 5'-phosphate oxidase family protein [bacterium]|nr:pyridoxamine 5'-phosphate oxidase family protein [bacterium]